MNDHACENGYCLCDPDEMDGWGDQYAIPGVTFGGALLTRASASALARRDRLERARLTRAR